ncbi:MAG TPA: hypothetical protein PLC65_02780, partial [Bacteroidia bacterium]|nr:hypothetical protein [Bacteroidia bacterium]
MKKLLLFFISCFNMVLLAGTKPNAGFIENKGQIHDQNFKPNTAVKYLLSIPGMNIQLKANSFSYDTYTVEQKSTETNRETVLTKLKHPKVENIYHFHRVDVEFIGANTQPEIIADYPSETYYNYYTTGTSEQGATNVRSYGKVTYKNIYPNIDLEFIAKEGKLKYNFIVHYGGDINVIKWKYYGANNTDIKNDNIIIDVKQGEFNEAIPVSYLLSNRKSKPIKIEFKLVDNGYYCFNLKQQMRLTPDQTLVIDPMPTVLWATYFGGNNSEYIYSSSLDYSANMYVTGYTNSTNNVATVGAFQSSFLGGSQDAILFKFNSLGTLRWATYYGRAGADYGTCVVAGRANNIYFSGWTSSSSAMSTAGSHQPFFGGGSDDGFLAKFDTNGVRIWSTYYGGSGYDDAWACSLD